MRAVIAVRGGSSLKDKNMRAYGGVPLLPGMVGKVLRVCGGCDVVTDSARYAEVARAAGAKVQLVGEIDGVTDVTLILREWAEREGVPEGEAVMLVQCTSPRLSERSLRRGVAAAGELKRGQVVMSVVPMECKGSAIMRLDMRGLLDTAVGDMPVPSVARQKLPGLWRYTGGVTIFAAGQLQWGSLFENADWLPLVLPEEEGLDIDREEDFAK